MSGRVTAPAAVLAVLALAISLPAAGSLQAGSDQAALLSLQEVRALHRQAHLERDAGLLVSTFADDFVSIQDGQVTRPSRGESLARFRAYFEQAEIVAWEDIEPPVIRMSDDGTMASVVVRKRVATRPVGAPPGNPIEETVFAWLETWERVPVGWRLTSLASTRRP